MSETTSHDDYESVDELAQLYRQHEESTELIQRGANRVTRFLGNPRTLSAVIVFIIAWISGNHFAEWVGWKAIETFPFPDLEFVATITALLVALVILTTQRHQDKLAERRAQLTLQIAVLSEKKVAKVIALLEEQRRESPLLASRIDDEAEAMAKPANTGESLKNVEEAID